MTTRIQAVTDRQVLGNVAQRAYKTGDENVVGGNPIPVYKVSDGELIENGGQFKVSGNKPQQFLVYEVTGETPLGGSALPIYITNNAPPVNPPTNLVATAVNYNQIDLAWQDNSGDELGFNIYRGGVLIDTVGANVTTYQNTGLDQDTNYSYYVTAFNGDGESVPSNTDDATTPFWTPSSPTTDGALLPHTWEVPGVDNFQDVAKTIPATEIGDVVGAVVNQGSDTHDVTQATTANKPTLQQVTINSVTSYVWRFDGAGFTGDDYLHGIFGGGAISQPFTIFAVEKLNIAAVNDGFARVIIGNTANLSMTLAVASSPNPDQFKINAGANIFLGATNSNDNIWTALFNGSSSSVWINGNLAGSGNAGTAGQDNIVIGGRGDFAGGATWAGDIGPILIYPGNLSTADKNQVGEYLERVTGIVWTTIV